MPGRIKGISESILEKLPRRILARMPRGIPEGIIVRISGGDLRGIPETLEAARIAYVIPGGVFQAGSLEKSNKKYLEKSLEKK